KLSKHLVKSTAIEDLTRPLVEINKVTHNPLTLNCSDNAMVVYYQTLTDSVAEKVKMMALNHLINQDYFNELRTNQQLGYLVGAGYAPFNTRAGIAFYVQSPNYAPETILARHNSFVNEYIASLEQLSEQQWQQKKRGLKTHIGEKDKNLRLRSQRLWLAIGNQDHQFHIQKKLLNELEKLSLQDILNYARATFQDDRPRYELLSSAKPNKQEKSEVYMHSL
ncbi:MAG: insulinase family protein, partial [Pseudoalteromonas sp.]